MLSQSLRQISLGRCVQVSAWPSGIFQPSLLEQSQSPLGLNRVEPLILASTSSSTKRAFASSTPIKPISIFDLSNLIEKGSKNFVLVDVRETNEVVATGLLPTAKHIPLGSVSSALKQEDSTFRETLGFEKPRLFDNIVFYCKNGSRSELACELTLKLGYKNVRNYKGSSLEWFPHIPQ